MKQTVLLIVFLLCSVPSYADEIKLVADPWCPYNCESGERPGFLVELTQRVFADAGHTVDYSLVPWKRAKIGVLDGVYDAIVGMARDVDTEQLYAFPEREMASSKICFYVPHDVDWTFDGLESLDSVRLGVINGYIYWHDGTPIDEYFKVGVASGKIQAVSGKTPLTQIIKMISLGRLSATLEDRNVMLYELQKMGTPGALKEAGCQEKTDQVYVAFSKKVSAGKEYARIMSEGLERLRKSGEYQRIIDSYTK